MYATTNNSGRGVTSPDSALASDVFDKYCNAVTFKSIMNHHRQLCDLLRLKPTYFPHFYPKLKAKLRSWKAQALWSKFDKRATQRCYNRGRPCANTRVLIIGGGPCGLRTAIEAQLLGAKVVVVEKRDRFSRNNVLHLWPFVIHDLRALGAKKFFGKFCAGSIDHISIRQLQCVLLKVALLLGVEVHESVTFEALVPPPEDQSIKVGWKAKVSPADHPVSQYEFDVLIGADGKRNTLEGFKRKEFRGRLAIAITANLVNRKSEAEARVEEISGVAFIFNQKFFRDLNSATGIDLENIVYYKDETHYFVMTAKKQSLLNKGVIIKDFPDTVKLLSPENVNKEALMEYAREAADFSTNYQLPHMDFAVNHYGQPDVAMFDFTSMFAAENASRVLERNGHKLLKCLVGDSLLEPFWPTGSGCARGWLSSFDACWAIHSWSSGRMTPLEVIAERESIYRLLAQTTPENLNKDYSAYTVEPQTRYPNLNSRVCLDFQVKCFYDTDNPTELERPVKAAVVEEGTRKRTKRPESFIHPDTLLVWLKKQIALYDMTVTDLTTSFQDGLALCAIIHRYRPDLLDFSSLDPANVAVNNQLAFDILEELGVTPVTTGYEMAQSAVPDKLSMLCYLTQVHELFRGEIPCVKQPKRELTESDEDILGACAKSGNNTTIPKRMVVPTPQRSQPKLRISSSGSAGKRKSLERGSSGEGGGKLGVERTPHNDTSSLRKGRKRRSTDRSQHNTAEREQTRQEIVANRLQRKERMAAFLRLQFDRSTLMLQAADPFQAGGFSKATENHMKEERNLQDDMAMFLYRLESDFEDKKRRLEKMLFYHPDRSAKPGTRSGDGSESLTNKVRDLEAKLKGNRAADKKPKDLIRAIGKLDKKNDWQLSALEKKIEENQTQGFSKDPHEKKVPKWNKDAFTDKFEAMNRRIHGLPTEAINDKYANLERGMKQLERKLKEGSALDTGSRGSNKVSAMAEQLAKKGPVAPSAVIHTEAETFRPKPVLNLPSQGGSEACHFCKKRVYLMERMSAEGKFFHRGCFRCEYCATTLRLSGYAFVRDDVLGGVFFCMAHVSMTYYMRNKALAAGKTERTGLAKTARGEPTVVISKPSQKTPDDDEDEETDSYKVIKNPLVEAAKEAEGEIFRRDGTPERVEFENSIAAEAASADDLSEIDEDEWTDHNFGISINSGSAGSEDEASSLDSSDEEDDDDSDDNEQIVEALNENIIELDRPLTADETRRLAENWKKRYSTDGSAPNPERNIEHEVIHEDDGENGVSIDVPAFPVTQESEKKSSEETSSDTEMGSDEELDYEEEGESDYENGDEEDLDEEDEEEEDEEPDSATEIETDSEFDQNSSVEVCVAPQGIPTIIVNESEAELKKSNDHLANGVEELVADIEEAPSAVNNGAQESSTPRPEYVDQYVSLENARPTLQRTVSHETGTSPAPGRSGILAYLRRSELLEKSPSAADLMASKNSLELKKKYMFDQPGLMGSLAQKSASATNLDNKFKSFVDTISEAQKKLNPAPQPSVPMQVFLQNTGNIFQPTPRLVPTHLPLKEEALATPKVIEEEPPTPTNKDSSSELVTPVADNAIQSNGKAASVESSQESSDDEEVDTEESSADSSSEEEIPPVQLPTVIVEEEVSTPAALESVREESEEREITQPKLALQEDFDLSPSNETTDASLMAELASLPPPPPIPRSQSRESIDSSKLALTETEFSDWADNSLGGDLNSELDSDPVHRLKDNPFEATTPIKSNGAHPDFDDIGFADESEAPDSKGYTKLVEELPSPDVKPFNESLEDSPDLSSLSFGRQRDSIAVYREKQAAAATPQAPPKDDKVQREMHRRILEKKCESSPNLLRKKSESLSQADLVRDMVLSRIRRSPEKTGGRDRRGSQGSLTPPGGSNRHSRSDSEPRTATPDRSDLFTTPKTPLRPLMESKSNEFVTPTSDHQKSQNGDIGPASVQREMFTPSSNPPQSEFKTPYPKERQEELSSSIDRHQSARMEARAKAQAKADRDLGMSPPDYIENLKEKLRRKPSTTDEDIPPPIPQRTRCFSEPNSEVDVKPPVPSVTPRTPVLPPAAALKTAKSVPQMVPPPSPRSDVLGHLFLQQQQAHMSPSSSTSPPLSPRSGSSSKSTSYLWAGLSPAESQNKLDEAAVVSVPTSSTSPTPRTVPVKKSKDRERRRSLIQTFTDLFKKEEVPKEPEATSVSPVNNSNGSAKKPKETKPSPSKFQLFKLSPKKDKSKEKLSDEADSGRLRSASSPVVPINDGEDTLKPRAGSYAATSPSSGSDSRPNTSMAEQRPLSSASGPLPPNSPPWSALSLSTAGGGAGPKKPSKQARQAARQTELKRLRMAQSIQRELEEMEVKQKELEDQGVRLEKALRGEDGGMSGRDESALMQEWFQLVHEKNALSRYEQELMVRAKKLELEDRHARLQQELKDRMSVDESMKSPADVDKEGAILAEMLKIVEQEDWLSSMLEEDRQRYREEDKDLEAQMLAKGLRLATIRPRKESQV